MDGLVGGFDSQNTGLQGSMFARAPKWLSPSYHREMPRRIVPTNVVPTNVVPTRVVPSAAIVIGAALLLSATQMAYAQGGDSPPEGDPPEGHSGSSAEAAGSIEADVSVGVDAGDTFDAPAPPMATYDAPREGAAGGTTSISPRDAQLLMILNADLQMLIENPAQRYIRAASYLLTGALSATFGVLTLNYPPLPYYFFLYAGAGIATAAIELFVQPDVANTAVAFQHMPMRTSSEAAARLHYGESALASIASRSTLARILQSSIEIGVGVAVVPILLAGSAGITIDDTWDLIVLISAAGAVVTGTIGLIIPSEAELRWRAYKDARALQDMQPGPRRATLPRLNLAAAPIPGGFLGGIGGRF